MPEDNNLTLRVPFRLEIIIFLIMRLEMIKDPKQRVTTDRGEDVPIRTRTREKEEKDVVAVMLLRVINLLGGKERDRRVKEDRAGMEIAINRAGRGEGSRGEKKEKMRERREKKGMGSPLKPSEVG